MTSAFQQLILASAGLSHTNDLAEQWISMNVEERKSMVFLKQITAVLADAAMDKADIHEPLT